MTRTTWERRIERAGELENEHPAAAEALRFYQDIARFQWDIQSKCADVASLQTQLTPLLDLVRRTGPEQLATAAERLRADPACWPRLFDHTPANDPADAFFSRVLLQSYTENAASHTVLQPGGSRPDCPFCGERPIAAVLRPEGEGGKRSLLCSLCFTEWEFRRLLCPNCGQEDHLKLPVYAAKEFPHVRVEACDSCRHYIKAIDLTVNGRAVPEVDELAAIPLDLWAAEHDYAKLAPNILGL